MRARIAMLITTARTTVLESLESGLGAARVTVFESLESVGGLGEEPAAVVVQ